MAIDDIALTLVPGLGVKGVVHLLEVFGTAQAIFAASADELAGRAELRPDVARSIAARKSHPEAERELRHCRRHGRRSGRARPDQGRVHDSGRRKRTLPADRPRGQGRCASRACRDRFRAV